MLLSERIVIELRDLERRGTWMGSMPAEEVGRIAKNAADIIEATSADKLDNPDEAYELGKRDGYEEAIQDLDLATGGDGEFKGSTLPGETVDVPVMKQRIIDRIASPVSKRVERLETALRESRQWLQIVADEYEKASGEPPHIADTIARIDQALQGRRS